MGTFADFLGASDDLAQARREMELKRLIAISQNPQTFNAAQLGQNVGRSVGGLFGGGGSQELQSANIIQAATSFTLNQGFTDPGQEGFAETMAAFFRENGRDDLAMKSLILGREAQSRARLEGAQVRSAEAGATTAESNAAVALATEGNRIVQSDIELATKGLQLQKLQSELSEETQRLKRIEKASKLQREVSKEMRSAENTLRDDYRQETPVKTFGNILPAWRAVETGFQSEHTGVSDLKIIMGYARLLDPGSVVRPSESEAVRDAMSLFENIGIAGDRVTQGHIMSQRQRQLIFNESLSLVQGMKADADAIRSLYIDRALEIGGRPSQVVGLSSKALPTPTEVNKLFTKEEEQLKERTADAVKKLGDSGARTATEAAEFWIEAFEQETGSPLEGVTSEEIRRFREAARKARERKTGQPVESLDTGPAVRLIEP